jgi:ribosomal protein S18 acetylase RimI-like enzyme
MRATQIRPAVVEDAAQIAGVHVRSWQGVYRGLMPQEYLDGLDPAERAEVWARVTSRADGTRSGVLVAEDETAVRGFVAFGPTRDEGEDRDQVGEIASIYAAPDAWGTGCGRDLMSAALEILAKAGYRQVTLWVLDGNARARRVYEAAGFHLDGAEQSDERDGFPLHELRYRRPLAT